MGLVHSFYLNYINLYYRNIIPLVTGTTVRHINSNDLNSLNTIIPNKKEQKYVKNYFNIIENLITLHQRRGKISNNIKNWDSHEYLLDHSL